MMQHLDLFVQGHAVPVPAPLCSELVYKERARVYTQHPKRVRGLLVQELARKQAEDQAAREAQVFLQNPRSPQRLHTVSKPFNLASNQAQVCSPGSPQLCMR